MVLAYVSAVTLLAFFSVLAFQVMLVLRIDWHYDLSWPLVFLPLGYLALVLMSLAVCNAFARYQTKQWQWRHAEWASPHMAAVSWASLIHPPPT